MGLLWFPLKALVYLGVAALGRWRWGAGLSHPTVRVFLAAFARLALGIVVGVPAGLILHGMAGQTGFTVVFFALRFALWLLVLWVAFRRAPRSELLGLAAAGTFANAALDLMLDESVYSSFSFNIC